MRALIVLSGTVLALSACGRDDQANSSLTTDDNLTAASIVSNDVTAIDAVTGDAANMAADVDMNFGGLSNEAESNAGQAAPQESRPAPAKPSGEAETNSTANVTANAE